GGIWTSTCDPMHFEATELTIQLLEGGAKVENQALWEQRMKQFGPVLPPQPAETGGKRKIIDHATGKVLAEYTLAPGGDHSETQGKWYVKV
ncbi:MAG TPA: hypothetical protein PLZ61_04270, partial [Candidatus Cryosericum sp.]|nr:hypothetical protein [Candidatus Cryosericum sp.]